jgi:NH3-dependent NAD+ synthetase
MFNAKKVKDEIVQWIRDWFEENGPGCNACIGISSGKDSTVVAALCCEALGKDRVIGVMMPDGEQADIDKSYEVLDRYIETGVCEDAEVKTRIDYLHEKNRFKRCPIPCFHLDQYDL